MAAPPPPEGKDEGHPIYLQCPSVVRDESRDSELRNLGDPMHSPLLESFFSLVKLFPYQCGTLSDAFSFSFVHLKQYLFYLSYTHKVRLYF